MDPVGNSNEEAANAVQYSLMQKEITKKLLGQATDNGGGSTLEHFENELHKLGTTNQIHYFYRKLHPP